MRVGHRPTDGGGRLGKLGSYVFFVAFGLLSMGMGDCEEGSAGFIAITSPAAGTVYSTAQSVTIEATVVDELLGDVSKVEFYDGTMDGQPKCTDATGPDYQCAWSVTDNDNGTHSWTARAHFNNSTTVDSAAVELTVAIDPDTHGNGSLGQGLVGYVPGVGRARDVIVDPNADLAYVTSMEFGLAVVDVSDPAELRTIATTRPFEGLGLALDLARGRAIVGSPDGLHVVDVSDPTAPAVIGHLAERSAAVELIGDFACAREGRDLFFVDLRTPKSPVVVSRMALASVGGIAVSGSLVYAGAGSTFHVIDASNPSAPSIVGTLSLPTGALSMKVRGSRVYAGASTGFSVIDVSTPSAPVLEGPGAAVVASSMEILGDRLFVAGSDRVRVFDIGTPAAPSLLATSGYFHFTPTTMDAVGSLAFFANANPGYSDDSAGLFTLDLGNLELVGRSTQGFYTGGVAVAGTTAVVTGQGVGMRVVDVSDPETPVVVGTLPNGVSMSGAVLKDGFAYVRAGRDVVTVDIRIPEAPVIAHQVTLSSSGGIALFGTHLYAGGGGTLHVFDVSQASDPQAVGSVMLSNGAGALVADGEFVYAGASNGFSVVDMSTPAHPTVVTWRPGSMSAMAIANDTLYAVGWADQLVTFDVSDPTDPVELARAYSYGASGLLPVGDEIFISGQSVVYVYDASNPGVPVLDREIRIPGRSRAATYANGFVYVADNMATLDVIKP